MIGREIERDGGGGGGGDLSRRVTSARVCMGSLLCA